MLIPIIVVVSLLVIAGIIFSVVRSNGSKPNKKANSQQHKDSEFVQRLSYLLKIVIEHSSSERRQSSTREVVRIGEEIHQAGGFRYMIKIHEIVTQQNSEKVGARLRALWKGIGDWRA